MTRSRDFAQGATRTEFIYTATAGQTSFSGNDTNSVSLAYTAGQIDVYLNGSRLAPADYTATNGTAVVLGVGAEASDTLQINAFGTFNVANVVATRDLEGNEFVLDDDGDTTITADTDDQIDIKIAGADDFKFTANTFSALDGSSVLIGGQSADSIGGVTCTAQIEGTAVGDSSLSLKCNANATTAPTIRFGKSRGTAVGSDTVVQDGDELGVIVFAGADGTDTETQGAVVIAAVDGTPGSNDLPTRLVFQTTADGAASTSERMRIDNAGKVGINTTSIQGTFHVDSEFDGSYGRAAILASTGDPTGDASNQLFVSAFTGDANVTNATFLSMRDSDGEIGNITANGASSVAYNTSSDYRLKENVDYAFDATTRLKQLKPCRFNFIADPDTTKDGFLAHEVSSIVPEAIRGTKDETRACVNVVKKADGTMIHENVTEAEWTQGKTDEIYANDTTWSATATVPKYQGIDHSKLVPLLVKTIQELEARIKTLEDA